MDLGTVRLVHSWWMAHWTCSVTVWLEEKCWSGYGVNVIPNILNGFFCAVRGNIIATSWEVRRRDERVAAKAKGDLGSAWVPSKPQRWPLAIDCAHSGLLLAASWQRTKKVPPRLRSNVHPWRSRPIFPIFSQHIRIRFRASDPLPAVDKITGLRNHGGDRQL